MMNYKLLQSNALVIMVLLISSLGLQAQDAETITPEWTEQWEPVPEIVAPGDPQTPPSDAIVLFDGTDLAQWESASGGNAEWRVSEGSFTVEAGKGAIQTREAFGDIQLHIEWRTPEEIEGEGQGRGNSGIFFMEKYELQVLDSYENKTYSNGQAGSLYKQHIPLVNASRPPGEWQTYDVVFMAPVFHENGRLRNPATITVFHNGVLVQNHVALEGPTVFRGKPKYEEHASELPLVLQDHSNPVSYRNIWVRRL